jgi:ribosome-binding protein aMBF1 (putative translation factor)
LAAELKVQRNTVWRWENGRMPRPKDWQKIEAVTGITGSQLAAFKAVAAEQVAA